MTYDAVVFDNDGVLVEPTDRDLLRGAIRSAFREHGVDDPDPDHVESLFHVTRNDLETVCAAYGLDPHDFWESRERNAIAAQRGAVERGEKSRYDDVRAVETLDVPTGVVSNNQHDTVEFVVDHYGFDHFETVYGREPTVAGIERKKPDPHYLDRALTDLDVENPLYVGDSGVDVAVADRLGIDSAFVRREHRTDYDLEHDPTHEIPDLSHLPRLLD